MKYGPVYEWYFMHFSQRKMIIDDNDICQENNVISYISMTLKTFYNFLVTILIILFYTEKSNHDIDILQCIFRERWPKQQRLQLPKPSISPFR